MRLIAATLLVLFLSATSLVGTAYDIMAPVVKVRMPRGLGSGVVVASSNDTTLVVTNAHVVGRSKECFVEVFIWDKKKEHIKGSILLKAKVVRTDSGVDLALIEFDTLIGVLPVVEFGSTDGVQILDKIYHVVAPYIEDVQIFRGVVIDRDCHGLLQIDAPAQPGCSGGAVYDNKLKVIGIVCAGYPGSDMSYAIKVESLKKFLRNSSWFGWIL